MKAVFDTNVLISALITTGRPRKLLQMAIEKQIELITSKPLLAEFSEVASDPKIRKYVDAQDVAHFIEIISQIATIVEVKSRFKAVKADPDDDVVLWTAFDGKADVVVSGDRHLLTLENFRGINILTAEQILALLPKE